MDEKGSDGQCLLQDGRGDVVRQISRHHRRSPLSEIGLQDVGVENVQIRGVREPIPEMIHQRGIGFDGNGPTGAPQQVFRQRPPPRPDLDHLFDAVRACCTRNLFQNGPAIEEMLT